MKKTILYSLIACVIAIMSVTAANAQNRMTAEEYIQKYKKLAIEEQEIYGIPASITMAQGILESDAGNSRLAVEANNHFGIKCKKEWSGKTITHDDDEKNECFRKYKSPEQSYRDHSEFLDKSQRYQELFKLHITDYKGWAHGLKKAGYATNPKYAHLLIKIIEDYELYKLDSGDRRTHQKQTEKLVLTKDEANKRQNQVVKVDDFAVQVSTIAGYAVYKTNGVKYVVAKNNDSFKTIAKSLETSKYRLRRYNDADKATSINAGERVYIERKANKAYGNQSVHYVKSGETLRGISQLYGVKLKKIIRKNKIDNPDVIVPGQAISLK